MHKSIDFLKEEKIFKNNIIFLDIDGVIQPYNNQNRFKYNMNETKEFLYKKYKDKVYLNIDIYDLCAAYYDWDNIAIGILKEIIFKFNCNIVIHSGWREFLNLNELKALFKLYDLDEYIIDVVDKGLKVPAIKKYLNEHPEIDNYVVIDDDHFERDFGKHFCCTKDRLNLDDFHYIQKVFLERYNIDFIENSILYNKTYEDKETENILKFLYKEKVLEDKKYMILTSFSNLNYVSKIDIKYIFAEIIKYCKIKDISGCILLNNKENIFDILKIYIGNKRDFSRENSLNYFDIEYKGYKSLNYFYQNYDKFLEFMEKESWIQF